MNSRRPSFPLVVLLGLLLLTSFSPLASAEDEGQDVSEAPAANEPVKPLPEESSKKDRKGEKRKFITAYNNQSRVDAGVFHVGFAAGGNFYIEPKVDATTKAPLGEYYKDFGFQAGVFFDYDYSEMDENIPLALRGMVGYKYILNSVHTFSFDGVVRHMWRLSEKATFGLGIGGSAAVWYRSVTSSSPDEEFIFLPSFVTSAGFEFDPFMVDFKWLINRMGQDSTITGLELYFGFRL